MAATRAYPDPNNGSLDEFLQAMKKVQLSLFDGEDTAGWIVCAEIYFQVQGTHLDIIKVKLAQLYTEGSTIHIFKSLIDEHTS